MHSTSAKVDAASDGNEAPAATTPAPVALKGSRNDEQAAKLASTHTTPPAKADGRKRLPKLNFETPLQRSSREAKEADAARIRELKKHLQEKTEKLV